MIGDGLRAVESGSGHPRRWWRVRAACLISISLLARGSPAQPTELTLWHAYRGEEKAALEKVVDSFNRAHAREGLHVLTLAVPYDAFADKISAAVPRGKGPDVFISAQDRLGGWVEAGRTVEPIDFFADAGLRARFLPKTLEAMTYRKRLYGLPLDFKAVAMFYNRRLIPQPPRTSVELESMAKKLTDRTAGHFGLAYDYSEFYYHAALLNAFGGAIFAHGPRPVIDSPENVRSLEQLLRWMDVDQILPTEPSTALITSLFNDGKAAIVFSGPWFIGEIAKQIDYGIAPLPALTEAGGRPMAPWMTVEGVFVAASSRDVDASFELAKALTGDAAARVLALEGRQLPANRDIYADPAIARDPVLSAFRSQAETAIPLPNLPEMTMVWSPAARAMNAVTHRQLSPRAALEEVQRAVLHDIAGLRGTGP